VRHVECRRQPRRVLIDSRLDTPLDAKILRGEPPLILTVSDDKAKRDALAAKGAQVVRVPNEGEKTDLAAVAKLLGDLEFNEVTVETGGKLMGSLLRARVVDELVVYYAGILLGDKGQAMFVLPEWARLDEAMKARIVDVRMVGPDVRLTARFGD
jgi:diaminohydroxyphosphoribosylaminopyrimidine deaminase/5-amino-6-(5-phosphoribosylamino)uracil reductase